MARPRTDKVTEVGERLRTRLRSGVHRPGDRFLSTREVASAFEISYQTAHRVIRELEDEGLLERRAGAGTFIPGALGEWRGVHLLFGSRARRKSSFGARLLGDLQRRLERDRIEWKMSWVEGTSASASTSSASRLLRARYFPVVWEAPRVLDECVREKRGALLLNDRPRPGLAAAWFDSVSIDDFSGGVCAAQLLLEGAGQQPELAVLAGPDEDPRSSARRDGFLSLAAGASVVEAGSWFLEDGYARAEQVVAQGTHGVFCCNDRLAQAVEGWCRDKGVPRPRIVGFDDAPVAEELNLTTIAIPWDEVIAGAVELAKRRLGGDASAARQLIVTPRPIVRLL
jgi:hypothetical protein